jgi:hypothetical protein
MLTTSSVHLFAMPEKISRATERARYSHASATVIVDDLDALTTTLIASGAEITTPEATSATGRFLYARHRGGAEVEYVEWVPELVERIIRAQPV